MATLDASAAALAWPAWHTDGTRPYQVSSQMTIAARTAIARYLIARFS
jgi:hypothetical protein